MWKKFKVYLVCMLIPLAVGGLAAFLTRNNMMLYDEITKPPLAPPAVLFPIVWTVLYILMGIGCARVYLHKDLQPMKVLEALRVYVLQLLLNFFWSLIFFNARAFGAAFLWIVALWIFVILMVLKFLKIDFVAGVINIPYIVWVTFATYLSFSIYILN